MKNTRRLSAAGSNSSRWWTRSRRIRTAASIPVEIPIAETREPHVYQRIAAKATQLRELGMACPAIGRKLGVDRWTVGKAVRWLQQSGGIPCNTSFLD
jgi:hypothetical protein